MKRIIETLLLLALSLSILSGCGEQKEGKSNGRTVDDFVKSYTNYSVGDEYYENNDLDYCMLYDIKMSDSDITENGNKKEYTFPLFVSLYGTTAEMKITADKNDYIDFVVVSMDESVLNLFESSEELAIYYITVLRSVNADLTSERASDAVEALWNQDGDTKETTVDNAKLKLDYANETIEFSINMFE